MTGKIAGATGTYRFTSWDEGPYAEHDGAPKLTRCAVANLYDGDLAGRAARSS